MSSKEPRPGVYQHYKGGLYEVLGVADEPESGGRFVVYRSLGVTENLVDGNGPGEQLGRGLVRNATRGALAVCSVPRFAELVDGKEYSDGQRVPRFRPLVEDRG